MIDRDILKEYIQAFLGYEDEARQTREARKDFKASFMERNGLTKSEMKMIEGAIKINMKLDTDFEINMFVENVQKVSEYFNNAAGATNNVVDECDNPLLGDPLENKPVAKPKKEMEWNPPPAPVIPTDKKNLKN